MIVHLEFSDGEVKKLSALIKEEKSLDRVRPTDVREWIEALIRLEISRGEPYFSIGKLQS